VSVCPVDSCISMQRLTTGNDPRTGNAITDEKLTWTMPISDDDLINAAKDARENAYCHYSGYSVGAAIIDNEGHLHVGCNVENAAYPLGNCAEAAAIAAMVMEGGKRIDRIAAL